MAQTILKEQEVGLLPKPNRVDNLISNKKDDFASEKEKNPVVEKTIALLMSLVKENNYLPYQLLKKKKGKKKRTLHYRNS